jgi:hypothetical protein
MELDDGFMCTFIQYTSSTYPCTDPYHVNFTCMFLCVNISLIDADVAIVDGEYVVRLVIPTTCRLLFSPLVS